MQSLILRASLAFEFAGRVKISGRPSLEKNYIFGILVERSINYVISFNLKNMKI